MQSLGKRIGELSHSQERSLSRVSVRYTSRMADNGSTEEKPKTAKQLEKERIKREKQAKFAEKQAKLAAAAKNSTVRLCLCTVCAPCSYPSFLQWLGQRERQE